MADSGFRHELDINTLSWVKSEIDTTLEQAHKALEAYEESPDDDTQIKFCLNYLHQVHGTLKMVELYGASLVAEELETLTMALSQDDVSNKDDTFQILIKGMVQLPDYLENLLSGHKDMPVILLPLLNDMRAARGENLLTENALFSPDLDVAAPNDISVDSNTGDLQVLAKKLRHSYHLGLLHWFTDKNVLGGIKQVSKVVDQLREAANDSEVNKLLWVASGVLEGLREGGLESSIAVKLLAGNVDREIKKIIDHGETDYLKEPPKELIKNLLYYVSCSSTNGDAVREIKRAFKLQDIMPSTKVLEQARADLAGPNAALMQTVSTVLMEELTQVKDNLDVFVRSENKDIEHLQPLSIALAQMSDTLGMLGLGIQRATIKEQKQRLDLMISGENDINDADLMDIAGSLISVENSLNDLGQLKGNKFNDDTVEQTLQNAEKQKLLKSVISEAKVDLSNVKESLSAFSREPDNHELLKDIPASLSQIQGSLSILNLSRASDLLDECNQFIQKDLIEQQLVPELTTLETLADAISSIEYFLESLAENWGQPDAILEVAEQSLRKIRGSDFSIDVSGKGDPVNNSENLSPVIDEFSIKNQNSNETQEIGLDTQIEIDLASLDLDKFDSNKADSNELSSELELDISPLSPEDGSSDDDNTEVINLKFDGTKSEEFVLEPGLSLEVDNDAIDDDLKDNQDNIESALNFDSDIPPPGKEGTPDPFDLTKLDNLPPENTENNEAGLAIASTSAIPQAAIDKLPRTLLLWYENSEHEEIINQLRKLLNEINEQIKLSSNESALKIIVDMEAIINCVVTGEESLNDDLINTINWAKDTLVDQMSATDSNEHQAVIVQKDKRDFEITNDYAIDFNPTEEIVNTFHETHKLSDNTGRTFLADIDEEIIEIFLEESQEEFDNIMRLLVVWKEDITDDSSLQDMRRSFHTLKGSGRLVGAQELGEFAWSFENMLNHVIDGAIEKSPEVLVALDQAVIVFPTLFEQISSGEKPDQHILQLMEMAESLSLGNPVDISVFENKIDTAGSGTKNTDFESEEFQLNLSNDSDSSIQKNNIIDIKAAETSSTELNSADESINGELTQEIVGVEFPANVQDIAAELIDSEKTQENIVLNEPLDEINLSIEHGFDTNDTAEIEINEESLDATGESTEFNTNTVPDVDPVLLEIYKNEANNHIESISHYIYNWKNDNTKIVTAELIRALHTLKGSSRTAGFIPLAETCAEFEKVAKILEDNELEVDLAIMHVLDENLAYAQQVVALVDNPGEMIPDNTLLLQEIINIHHSLTSTHDSTKTTATPDLSPKENLVAATPVISHDYDEELLEIFLEEGIEILDDSDHCIHEWIDDVDNPKHIEALQRYLHTLKGGARMAGITEIGDLSHSLESVLTAIVQGELKPNNDVFKILQKSHDQLVKMLEQIASRQVLDSGEFLLKQVEALLAGEPIQDVAIEQDVGDIATEKNRLSDNDSNTNNLGQVDDLEDPEYQQSEEIYDAESELDITSEEVIEAEFDESQLAGTLSESLYENLSSTSDIIDLDDNVTAIDSSGLPANLEPVVADISPAKKQDISTRRGSGEQVRVRADLLDSLVNFAGEVSIYRSRMEQQVNTFRYNLVEFDDTVLRLRSQLRQFEIETETQMQSRYQNETGKTHADFDPLEFDRFTQMQQLSRGMLESLNDLDSLRAILSNLTRESETLLVQQSRVNTELQEGLMRTRMVPFSGQLSRLRRIVRQTAEELNKQVELKLTGVENEIDRTVLERILAPLEHMLRNAIAHGIELPEQRHDTGKPEKGVINLIVARDGSDLIITVSDDGQGIDLTAIREKALASGKLEPESQVADQVLFDMILEPGFSTASDITQISGRGVGMDVVNSEVQQLGGVFHIESEQGLGSKFSIRLPLTLSITRALMVNIADETFALPLLSVQGIERIPSNEVLKLVENKNSSFHWVGEDYKLIHLASEMGISKVESPVDNKMVPILLVQSGEYRAAIIVDHLIGSREIVVKNIGPELSVLRGISGATIMGDGSVVLILDLSVLIQLTMSIDYDAAALEIIEDEKEKVTNVMVVDDSITVRKVTTRFLERNDMSVTTAKDGVDALAQLLDFVPDIMLLDVEMPRMDGFELANNMRNDDRFKNIPIIMITSRTGEKHRERAMEIGVNAYIGKPYQEIELLEKIQTLISK